MKIDRTKQPTTDWKPEETDVSRAHRVRRILNEDSHHQPISKQFQWHGRPERRVHAGKFSYVPIDLFGAKPLGIFPTKTTPSSSETPFLSTWDRIHEKELKLAAMHPPANGFEEMILWTEQGKLWHFPIDNEQGICILFNFKSGDMSLLKMFFVWVSHWRRRKVRLYRSCIS